MKIKSSQTLVSEALQDIKTISTDEAYNLSIKDQCNLIDIRDIRELEKEGRVSKGDGKDVDHKRPLRHGGTNNDSNLRVRDKSSNRAENGKKSVKEEHGAGFEGTSSLLNKYLRQTPGQYVPKKKEKNDKNINKT